MTTSRQLDPGLLGSRYESLAPNTIDYWMRPDEPTLALDQLRTAIEQAPVLDGASLGIYVHVPFCAQRCRFCAFSGGNSLEFAQAERYARLVAQQLCDLHDRVLIRGHFVRSVNIGGGSPDLLKTHIGSLLRSIRELPGVTALTEISVEMTLSSTAEASSRSAKMFRLWKVMSRKLLAVSPERGQAVRQVGSGLGLRAYVLRLTTRGRAVHAAALASRWLRLCRAELLLPRFFAWREDSVGGSGRRSDPETTASAASAIRCRARRATDLASQHSWLDAGRRCADISLVGCGRRLR